MKAEEIIEKNRLKKEAKIEHENPTWLEIGSGSNPTEGYVHLDANPLAPHVEIVGDVRAIFIPQDYSIEDYPDLKRLRPIGDQELGLFERIKLGHFIEHIHWYNQPAMWHWLNLLLTDYGVLEIETPDLEYICKTYLYNRKWWRKILLGRRLYPQGEHPDIVENTRYELSRWLAFKLYSGGSYDKASKQHDYHLGLYDKVRLEADLKAAGFKPYIRRQRGRLLAKAVKVVKLTKRDDRFIG